MLVVLKYDVNLVEYFQRYNIDYEITDTTIITNGFDQFFEELIIGNDLDQLTKLEHIINSYGNKITLLTPILEKASNEMVKLLLNLVKDWNGSRSNVIKTIASRCDDLDLFQYCANIIKFPELFNKLGVYEQKHISTIYDVLAISVDEGHYSIFNYVATTCGLSICHSRTLNNLKSILLRTPNFNPKILDFMRDYVEITVFDIEYLIDNEHIHQLEYIIDLIDSGVFVFSPSEIEHFISLAKSQQIKELFTSLS
jgi:hypothetical protein